MNEKLIITPDIHGVSLWKEQVLKYPDYRAIFIGDFFDAFSIPYPAWWYLQI